MVIWLTGKPAAGKTTLAKHLFDSFERLVPELSKLDKLHLDGDGFRARFGNDLGFAPEDRLENLRRAATIAAWASYDSVVICSFVSPYEESRRVVAELCGERFFLVEVHCPTEVCEERDPKGLYAKARAGEIPEFTGVSAPYERPKGALVVDTSKGSVGDCMNMLACAVRASLS
jgi:adenylyl-sulfate kinase